MTSLWLVDPAAINRPVGNKRKIGRGPLIDLLGLQAAIKDKVLSHGTVELATKRAEREMGNLSWEVKDLLDCIASLKTDDFRDSEWCEDRYGQWHPSDAYEIRYDHIARSRIRFSDISYFLKFSIDEDGALVLTVISVHLS